MLQGSMRLLRWKTTPLDATRTCLIGRSTPLGAIPLFLVHVSRQTNIVD